MRRLLACRFGLAAQLRFRFHIGTGAEPSGHAPFRIANRYDARDERSERAIAAAKRIGHLEWRARLETRPPALEHRRQRALMMHGLPSPSFHLGGRSTRVLVPACVEPVDVAIRPRRPGERGNGIGERAQFRLARTQHCLGAGALCDVAPEHRDAAFVDRIYVRVDDEVQARIDVVVSEVCFNTLFSHPPILTFELGADRAGKQVPQTAAEQIVARDPDAPLHCTVHREASEVLIECAIGVFHPLQQARRTTLGAGRDVEQPFALVLGEHSMRRLLAHHERAGDASIVAGDRAVAVRPPHVLESAVAHDGHELILVPRRFAVGHHLGDLGSDDVPDLHPELRAPCTQRADVPAALTEARPVCIIENLNELRAPPEEHGLARGEHHGDGGLQADRPLGHGTERCGGPVERTTE